MPHLLKRLELNGFKSFADKTVFTFPEGITAVVGPNGSGKSNIIDAMRWLLGERDAKSLRGGKSEDLIFGGTPKRPRMGQAQASVYFENTNNFFNVDFAEIVVTRQVNRDGENKYFVNGAEVRLKDLVDFFAQARLGARGLVVITQGNSDMFIRVSPNERREMIEEMLGLREYELKKAEAERRLKNTQINLDKVKALIDEIMPHLRSLKRQTSRWEKRGVLEEELRSLENAFFGAEYRALIKERTAIEAKLAERREAESGFLEARTKAEEHLKAVEAAQPEEREELLALKHKTRALLDERSALQKDIGRIEAQLELHTKQNNASLPSQEALIDLTDRIRGALTDLSFDSLELVKKTVRVVLNDIDGVLNANHAKTAPVEHDTLTKEFARIHAALEALEVSLRDIMDREKHLEKSQEEFYVTFKTAVASLDEAKKRIEQWEAETREIEFAKERVAIRMSEWERQVEQAGRHPHEFANVHEAAPGSRDDFERRIFKLRGDLASMGEVDAALVKEAQETEARYEFLNREMSDLLKAREDLRALIVELKGKIKTEFDAALVKINKELGTFFELMFGGGHAELVLAKPKRKKAEEPDAMQDIPEAEGVSDAVDIPEEEDVEEGIEIDLKLPKKRITSLEMLSGGERSLVGIAALFALISVSPPPFLVLDEVDAPLDERNARRFADMLKQFSKETQFILVTHNRATMEAANILYGMTMKDDGTSTVVSLQLSEYTQ